MTLSRMIMVLERFSTSPSQLRLQITAEPPIGYISVPSRFTSGSLVGSASDGCVTPSDAHHNS